MLGALAAHLMVTFLPVLLLYPVPAAFIHQSPSDMGALHEEQVQLVQMVISSCMFECQHEQVCC